MPYVKLLNGKVSRYAGSNKKERKLSDDPEWKYLGRGRICSYKGEIYDNLIIYAWARKDGRIPVWKPKQA